MVGVLSEHRVLVGEGMERLGDFKGRGRRRKSKKLGGTAPASIGDSYPSFPTSKKLGISVIIEEFQRVLFQGGLISLPGDLERWFEKITNGGFQGLHADHQGGVERKTLRQ